MAWMATPAGGLADPDPRRFPLHDNIPGGGLNQCCLQRAVSWWSMAPCSNCPGCWWERATSTPWLCKTGKRQPAVGATPIPALSKISHASSSILLAVLACGQGGLGGEPFGWWMPGRRRVRWRCGPLIAPCFPQTNDWPNNRPLPHDHLERLARCKVIYSISNLCATMKWELTVGVLHLNSLSSCEG